MKERNLEHRLDVKAGQMLGDWYLLEVAGGKVEAIRPLVEKGVATMSLNELREAGERIRGGRQANRRRRNKTA